MSISSILKTDGMNFSKKNISLHRRSSSNPTGLKVGTGKTAKVAYKNLKDTSSRRVIHERRKSTPIYLKIGSDKDLIVDYKNSKNSSDRTVIHERRKSTPINLKFILFDSKNRKNFTKLENQLQFHHLKKRLSQQATIPEEEESEIRLNSFLRELNNEYFDKQKTSDSASSNGLSKNEYIRIMKAKKAKKMRLGVSKITLLLIPTIIGSTFYLFYDVYTSLRNKPYSITTNEKEIQKVSRKIINFNDSLEKVNTHLKNEFNIHKKQILKNLKESNTEYQNYARTRMSIKLELEKSKKELSQLKDELKTFETNVDKTEKQYKLGLVDLNKRIAELNIDIGEYSLQISKIEPKMNELILDMDKKAFISCIDKVKNNQDIKDKLSLPLKRKETIKKSIQEEKDNKQALLEKKQKIFKSRKWRGFLERNCTYKGVQRDFLQARHLHSVLKIGLTDQTSFFINTKNIENFNQLPVKLQVVKLKENYVELQ